MLRMLMILWRQELRICMKHVGEMLYPLGFFLIFVTFFPLTFGPDAPMLKSLGAGVLWLGILLSTLLSAARMFQRDAEDGTLEQWLTQPIALEFVVLAKGLAQWIMIAGPMLLSLPLLTLVLDIGSWKVELLGLVFGSGIFVFLSMLGAALMIEKANAGTGSLMVIMMPLFIPALIFGAGMHFEPERASQSLSALAGLFLFAAPLSCIVSATLIRYSQR